MGRLVVSENVCTDGAVQDPIGEDGFERGGWFTEMGPGDYEAWAQVELDEALAADALLLGRHTDRFFGRVWNTREGVWADRLRELPKYVVSATVTEAVWVNSTVVSGPVVDAVTGLKSRYERDIVVYGSGQLVRALFEHDLVDEVRLTVHPWLIGAGDRIFDGLGARRGLRLLSNNRIGANLAHLAYEVVRPPT